MSVLTRSVKTDSQASGVPLSIKMSPMQDGLNQFQDGVSFQQYLHLRMVVITCNLYWWQFTEVYKHIWGQCNLRCGGGSDRGGNGNGAVYIYIYTYVCVYTYIQCCSYAIYIILQLSLSLLV